MASHCFSCISLMRTKTHHLFIFVDHLCFSAVNGLLVFFPPFSIGLSFLPSFLPSFLSFLSVLVGRTFLCCGYYLLITCLTNIFISVYHLCFIFNFLNGVFEENFTFLWEKSNFFIYGI